jgi:hypothetical protein
MMLRITAEYIEGTSIHIFVAYARKALHINISLRDGLIA